MNKSISGKEKNSVWKNIMIGALIGGILGAFVSLLSGTTDRVISSILIGIVAGGAIYSLYASYSPHSSAADSKDSTASSSALLKLREEQLEISKEFVQMGDVATHTEITTEEKVINVPINREELVIEKKTFGKEAQDKDSGYEEVLRIPIMEEQIEIVKHPVTLEDVSVYKRKFHEMEHIKETLKKEKAHIETSGSIRIVEKQNHSSKPKKH